MSTDEQEDRLISLISGIGLTKVLNGAYGAEEGGRSSRRWRSVGGWTASSSPVTSSRPSPSRGSGQDHAVQAGGGLHRRYVHDGR
jgi:hypothetical protein